MKCKHTKFCFDGWISLTNLGKILFVLLLCQCVFYTYINPVFTQMLPADDRQKILNFSKMFRNSNFRCYIWIQHEKCIQMSTNKPSIGSVVLEKAPMQFAENFVKLCNTNLTAVVKSVNYFSLSFKALENQKDAKLKCEHCIFYQQFATSL